MFLDQRQQPYLREKTGRLLLKAGITMDIEDLEDIGENVAIEATKAVEGGPLHPLVRQYTY